MLMLVVCPDNVVFNELQQFLANYVFSYVLQVGLLSVFSPFFFIGLPILSCVLLITFAFPVLTYKMLKENKDNA